MFPRRPWSRVLRQDWYQPSNESYFGNCKWLGCSQRRSHYLNCSLRRAARPSREVASNRPQFRVVPHRDCQQGRFYGFENSTRGAAQPETKIQEGCRVHGIYDIPKRTVDKAGVMALPQKKRTLSVGGARLAPLLRPVRGGTFRRACASAYRILRSRDQLPGKALQLARGWQPPSKCVPTGGPAPSVRGPIPV